MIRETVYEQACLKCDRRQLAGATVFLPFKQSRGERPYFPPVIVCAPCRPSASKDWSYLEASVVAS